MISKSKLRALALSLLVLFTMAITLPWPDASAHHKGRAHIHHRHHSRAWWRKYRARLRRQRAAIARRNALTAMRGHSSVTESTFGANTQKGDAAKSMPAFASRRLAASSVSTGGVFNDPRNQLSMMMPSGWSGKPVTNNSGETKFKVFAPDGRPAGQAELAVVASSAAPSNIVLPSKERNQMLGGVSFATLRRRVIDRMINEGGWVINDLQKDVNGRRAYVVLAQTPASKDGRTPAQTWTFYFTEVDGRIYSFSTTAPQEFTDQMSQGSEHVISTLRSSAHAFAEETSRR